MRLFLIKSISTHYIIKTREYATCACVREEIPYTVTEQIYNKSMNKIQFKNAGKMIEVEVDERGVILDGGFPIDAHAAQDLAIRALAKKADYFAAMSKKLEAIIDLVDFGVIDDAIKVLDDMPHVPAISFRREVALLHDYGRMANDEDAFMTELESERRINAVAIRGTLEWLAKYSNI